MKNLFIIDGAAGTGKSDLLKYLMKEKHGIGILQKKTTRDQRKEEEANDYILDLQFINEEEFKKLKNGNDIFYHYGYGDNQYGFFKSELERELSLHDNVVIIIRNNDLPQILKKEFPDVRIIFVYIYSDIVQVEKRLKKLGYDKEKIKYRLSRNKIAWDDYRKHSNKYDEILINNSDTTHYEALIEQLIAKYNQSTNDCIEISNQAKFELIKPLFGHKEEIVKMLEKYPYEKNVFIMMRYRPYNNHLFTHIEQIVNSKGFNCVRADIPDWNITHDVYNPIAVLYACKYGIALFDKPEDEKDMQNQYNPNVAYELGMMQLQKKKCLIFKHSSLVQVPFFDILKDLYSEYTYPADMNVHIENWIQTKLIK
jgi:guanylate kinase